VAVAASSQPPVNWVPKGGFMCGVAGSVVGESRGRMHNHSNAMQWTAITMSTAGTQPQVEPAFHKSCDDLR